MDRADVSVSRKLLGTDRLECPVGSTSAFHPFRTFRSRWSGRVRIRPVADIRIGRHTGAMAEFVAFTFVPVVAVWWIVVGSLGLLVTFWIGIVAFRREARMDRVEAAGRDAAKRLAALGAAFSFAIIVGIAMSRLAEQKADGPNTILFALASVSLLGGLAASFYLWWAFRRPR